MSSVLTAACRSVSLECTLTVEQSGCTPQPWQVLIFDDRIELISPGTLPNDLTIENIRSGVSNMRNPFISSFATKELPYRGIGTGVRRAVAAIPDLELVSDREANLFTAIIPRNIHNA